jgi:hypothetical protein
VLTNRVTVFRQARSCELPGVVFLTASTGLGPPTSQSRTEDDGCFSAVAFAFPFCRPIVASTVNEFNYNKPSESGSKWNVFETALGAATTLSRPDFIA